MHDKLQIWFSSWPPVMHDINDQLKWYSTTVTDGTDGREDVSGIGHIYDWCPSLKVLRHHWCKENTMNSNVKVSHAWPLPIRGILSSPVAQWLFNIGWSPPGKSLENLLSTQWSPPNQNGKQWKSGYKASEMGAGWGVWRIERQMGGSRETKEKEWEEGTHKVIKSEWGTERWWVSTDHMLILYKENQPLILHTARNEESSLNSNPTILHTN